MADPVNPSASEGSSQQNFDAQVLDDLTVLQQAGGTTGALGGVQGDVSERIVNEGDKDDPSLLHEPPAKVAQASGLQSEQNSVVNTVLTGGVMEAGQGRTSMPSSGGGALASSATTGAVDGAVADTDAAEPVRATNVMAQVVADQAVTPGPSDVPTQAATPRAGVMGSETVATDNAAETAGPSTTTQMDVETVADPINRPAPMPGPTSAPESVHANNGFGNGDQAAPGKSATNNNAENDASSGDTNKGGSAKAGGSDANNGVGNGDQAAPGKSATNNNAENDASSGDTNKGGSAKAGGSDANNGFGNGDQAAPGKSATNNNAENDASSGDTNKGGSAKAGGSDANNGFGNGDQAAPGKSATNNNAENDLNTSHTNASDAAHVTHAGDASGPQLDEFDLTVLLPQGDSSADQYALAMGGNETDSPVGAGSLGNGPASWVDAANNADGAPDQGGNAFDSTTETINFSSDVQGADNNWEVQDTNGLS